MNSALIPPGVVKVTTQAAKQIDTGNIFKINGEDYRCEFILYNSIDGKDHPNAIRLTKPALKSLVIEENLFEPFISATAVISNPADMIENRLLTKGNGTDRLYVSFYPVQNPELKGDDNKFISSEEIKIEYEFVIINEANSISETDRLNNFKIYSLVDLNYHKLNSRLPFEETDGIPAEFYGKPIGEIIRILLETNLGEDVIDTTEGNWDSGSHITTRQPETFDSLKTTNFRTSDLIKYLLSIYYKDESGTAVQGILHYNRLTPNKKHGLNLKKNAFSLRPLSKIFGDHKNKLTEGFILGELADDKTKGINKNNPAINDKIFSNVNQSQLPNVSLTTSMFNYSNRYFTNYKVNTHDILNGTYNSDQLYIQEAKTPWSALFVEVFSSAGGAPIAFLPLNKSTGPSKFKNITYPFNHDVNLKLAQAQMISNLTFLNLQLGFTNLGFTRRTCAQFIDVVRSVGTPMVDVYDSDTKSVKKLPGWSDAKVLGRWFVTNCRHELTENRYLNVIQCVKTYVGPDAKELIQ
tara:strand:- start:180 stop:1748 length:1569 start_codon:yes stop_codon:yes gene_type:complete